MPKIKFKAEIHGELDTLDYPTPADGRLTLNLRDDIENAIEDSVPVTINACKVTRTGGKKDDDEDSN